MSIQALEWARRQHVGDALAKSLLRAIADYADENGHCWPSIGRLASDCEVSEDTIRRKTKLLEDDAYLVRIKTWMDEHGRRNNDGRGRETSQEIRLHFARSPTPPAAAKADDSGRDEGSHTARVAACEGSSVQGAASHTATPGVAVVRPPIEPSLKKEDIPQSPLAANRVAEDEAVDEAFEQGWTCFVNAYPIDIVDVPLTRNLLKALTPDERKTITFAAWGYRKHVTDQERRSMDAHRFIRDGKWQGFVESGKRCAPKPPEPERKRHRLMLGSAEFVAFRLCCDIAEIAIPKPIGDPAFVEILGDVPQGANAMALIVDASAPWEVRTKDEPEFSAWCERVHEWTGRWPKPKRHWLNERNEIVPTVAQAYKPPQTGAFPSIPRSIDGLLVPHTDTGFPPPKGDATQNAA